MSSRNGKKHIVVLLGKEDQENSKCIIGDNIIEGENVFPKASNNCVQKESAKFVVINTPDLFNEYNNPDQQIFDCIALTEPGPHLFILVLDRGQDMQDKFTAQIDLLKEIFGEPVTTHLIVMSPSIDFVECKTFNDKKQKLEPTGKINYNDLAKECEKLCNRQHFVWNKGRYSAKHLAKRKLALKNREESMKTSCENHACQHPLPGHGEGAAAPQVTYVKAAQDQPSVHTAPVLENQYSRTSTAEPVQGNQQHPAPVPTQQTEVIYETPYEMPPEDPEEHGVQNMKARLNIVLLGQSGTGKSSTGNTLLAAGGSSSKPFMSKPSSLPVTKECNDVEGNLFGTLIKVIDTPDFFSESIERSEEQIMKCREYCSTDPLLFLLVTQIGRFTESERDILERHEQALDMRIRDKTIILLTHGEELKKKKLHEFIQADKHLQSVVELCGHRCHLINNNSTNPKQVIDLLKMVPNYWQVFPNLDNIDKLKNNVCAPS